MRENAKPLYFPWNEEAFQSDLDVRGMNNIERWIYRTLLQSCFFVSSRPYLPNNNESLWVLAGCKNKSEWMSNRRKPLKKFVEITINGHEVLENKRVSEDWNKLLQERLHMIDLGKKSAEVRRALNARSTVDGNSLNGPLDKRSEGKVSKSESESENSVLANQSETEGSMAKEKALHRKLTRIWQEVKGSEGALCPYPHFQREAFEDLARTVGHDVLEDAFRLFAQDARGPEQEKYPIDTFTQPKNASFYMLKARPAVEVAAPVDEALVAANAALTKKLLIAEAEKTLAPAPVRNEISAEDFMNTE